MSKKRSTGLPSSSNPRNGASPAGFSTVGVFLSISAAVAVIASALGYFVQLTNRLSLAESQVRLLQVNQDLLTQELAIERHLSSTVGSDISQLAGLHVVPLHPTPSPWILDSRFDIIWNEATGIGILSIHGMPGDALDHDLQLRIKVLREDRSLETIPIPTQRVPDLNSKRWFELVQSDDANVTGFELLMFLGDDSPDSVKFCGDLHH